MNTSNKCLVYTFKDALDTKYFLTKEQIEQVLSFGYYHQNDFPIPMHSHDFFEINIVLEGTGIHYVNNNSFQIRKGDFFIIPPNISHGYAEISDLNIFHIILSHGFNSKYNDLLKSIDGFPLLFNLEPNLRLNNIKYFTHIPSADFMFFNNEIEKLYELNNSPSIREAEKSIKTLNLICNLSAVIMKKTKNPTIHALVNVEPILNVVSYIDRNYMEKITLNDLCKLSNMSRSNLLRNFQQMNSCSPSDYILSVRLKNAIRLLETTDLQITEIAQECGFYDSSHFTKYFLLKEGVLPKDYRKTYSKDE